MMHDPSTRSERSEFAGQKWMQSSMPSHVDHQPRTTRLVLSYRPRPSGKGRLILVCCLLVLASTGCVSKGDFLRLQEKVAEAHASQANEPDPFTRIAKLSTEVEALRQEVRDLQGELELARKESADALVEARRTRTALAAGAPESIFI